MRSAWPLLVVGLLFGAGCGRDLKLNLVISDPCNADVLSAADLAYMEVVVESPELATPAKTTWTAGDGQGHLDALEPVASATVSVVGRRDGGGSPGASLLGTGVGYVDLSGTNDDETVELEVAVGRVHGFMRTTDTRNYSARRCTELIADRTNHSATLLDTGVVLITGGQRLSSTTNKFWSTTELYDPRLGLFSQGPDITARQGHSSTALSNGRVLIAGGVSYLNSEPAAVRVAVVYDGAGSFGGPITMQAARAYHTATLLEDGRVLIAGGIAGGAGSSTTTAKTTEVFDPGTGTSTPGPTLQVARAHHAAVRISRTIVALIGGQGDTDALDSVEFVDVAGASTAMGPKLSEKRSFPVAALIPGRDAIVVAGGFGTAVAQTGLQPKPEALSGSDTAEIMQLATTLTASRIECSGLVLSARRGDAAMAALSGQELVILGGVAAPGVANATAEVLSFAQPDVCDVQISSAGQMTAARAGMEATSLVGGDVLITGGYAITAGAPPTAESTSLSEIFIRSR